MIKRLFLASALGLSTVYFAQTNVFEEKFEDPAKRALWTMGDRDGITIPGNFWMPASMRLILSPAISQHHFRGILVLLHLTIHLQVLPSACHHQESCS